MKFKLWLPLIVFGLLAIALWWGLYKDPHQITSPLINKPLAAFSVENLLAPETPLTQADFVDQVTVLNVFATWCMACREENKLLMSIAASKEVRIYGLDYRDSRSKALAWLGNYGNPYEKILYDPHGELAIELGVYGTPESFVIDKNGIIRYKHIGVLNQKSWSESVLPLIQRLEQE